LPLFRSYIGMLLWLATLKHTLYVWTPGIRISTTNGCLYVVLVFSIPSARLPNEHKITKTTEKCLSKTIAFLVIIMRIHKASTYFWRLSRPSDEEITEKRKNMLQYKTQPHPLAKHFRCATFLMSLINAFARHSGRLGIRKRGWQRACSFMITQVSIRCQKKPGGWYTAYTRVYPPNTPLGLSRLELNEFFYSSK